MRSLNFFSLFLALLNADLFAQCGGVDALIKCTINCQLPRINDSLVATIIYLMNHPKTRRFVRMGIDLEVKGFVEQHLQLLEYRSR